MHLRRELLEWARYARENNFKDIHHKNMTKEAYEIDEILRKFGVEWVEDYELNNKIKTKIQ
jgi:hypothetical protein